MKSTACSFSILLLLALAPLARAQTVAGAPATIDYQGQVLDTSGNVLAPLAPTNYTMQFRIYNQQAGGSVIWAESQIVSVDKGAFSVRLGSGVPIPATAGGNEGTISDLRQAFSATERYLGLTVVIPGQPPAEVTPRLAFLSSPYSMVAERAKTADSAASAGVASSVIQNSGTSTLANLTLAGTGRINSANVLEFGTGVAGKQTDAGKIGYGTFSGGASLDITGAGTTGTNRRIQMFAEGGLTVNGPVTATSFTGNGAGLTNISADVTPGSITLAKLATDSVDLTKLVAAVKEALCPPGTIMAYGGNTPPAGWILCDGQAVSRATYPNLFAAISTNFGNAAGDAARFNVPDFRGRFLRGRDGGQGRDPDRAARSVSNDGGSAGDNVGSLQSFALQTHQHGFKDGYFAQAQPSGTTTGMTFSLAPNGWGQNGDIEVHANERVWERQATTTSVTGANTSTETRPLNVYVNYIIKY